MTSEVRTFEDEETLPQDKPSTGCGFMCLFLNDFVLKSFDVSLFRVCTQVGHMVSLCPHLFSHVSCFILNFVLEYL